MSPRAACRLVDQVSQCNKLTRNSITEAIAMLLRRATTCVTAACVLIVLTASLAMAQSDQSLWNKIQSSGTLVCGAMASNPPGSWKIGPDQYAGYEINFCNQVARDLSASMGKPITVQFHEITWSSVVLELQSGRIDVFPSMSVTEQRKQALDMTEPVLMLDECLVNRRGIPSYETWRDYSKPEMRIATVIGTSDAQAVHELAPNATILGFKELAAASLAVQAGRADAFGTSIIVCLDTAKRAPDVFGDIVVPKPGRPLPSSAGMRRDSDHRFFDWMNQWVTKIRVSGVNRQLLFDAIRQSGLDPSKLPAGVAF